MNFRLDIGRIVKQKIEYVVTLMLIGANNCRIDGDMVCHQGVGDDSFFQPKVFGRMACIDGVNSSFKFSV